MTRYGGRGEGPGKITGKRVAQGILRSGGNGCSVERAQPETRGRGNVAILPEPSKVTSPVTPGVTVKVVLVMVTGFIASLNAAVMTVPGHTLAVPLGGVVEVTAGGGAAAHATVAVAKVHTKLLVSALPDESSAPVVIVAV